MPKIQSSSTNRGQPGGKMRPVAESEGETMLDELPIFPVTYHQALAEYLAHPDEATLNQAYGLGRAAMTAGLGIADIIRLHHNALSDGVLPSSRTSGQI